MGKSHRQPKQSQPKVRFVFLFLLSVFLTSLTYIVIIVGPVFSDWQTGWRVNNTIQENVYPGNDTGTAPSGECYKVINNSGKDIFVPTKTHSEWEAFNAHKPAGVTTGSCCTPNCFGKDCGPDGCGGSCGSCASGFYCSLSGICTPCSCNWVGWGSCEASISCPSCYRIGSLHKKRRCDGCNVIDTKTYVDPLCNIEGGCDYLGCDDGCYDMGPSPSVQCVPCPTDQCTIGQCQYIEFFNGYKQYRCKLVNGPSTCPSYKDWVYERDCTPGFTIGSCCNP